MFKLFVYPVFYIYLVVIFCGAFIVCVRDREYKTVRAALQNLVYIPYAAYRVLANK